MITPETLSDFRLVKITYDHTLKEYELFERSVSDEDADEIMSAHRHVSTRIRRRNNIVDWIWANHSEIESLVRVLESNSMRYKLTDHTLTYYRSPEKLTTLRNEIDDFLTKFLNVDFVLDRIALVGIESITKLEKKHIENESSR